MNREHKITFRVTDYDKKQIQAKLKKSGIRLLDFCRYAVFGKEVWHIESLDKYNYELNKIGTSIDQIALLCHQRAVRYPNFERYNGSFVRSKGAFSVLRRRSRP